MTDEAVEIVAKKLYELDQQKGLRANPWHTGPEVKRDKYRLRARGLLAGEDLASVIARLEYQYSRTDRLIRQHP